MTITRGHEKLSADDENPKTLSIFTASFDDKISPVSHFTAVQLYLEHHLLENGQKNWTKLITNVEKHYYRI